MDGWKNRCRRLIVDLEQHIVLQLEQLGLSNPVLLERIERGQSNTCFSCTGSGVQWFVKYLPPGQYNPRWDCERHLEVWAANNQFGLPPSYISQDRRLLVYPWLSGGDYGHLKNTAQGIVASASIICRMVASSQPPALLQRLSRLDPIHDLIGYRRRLLSQIESPCGDLQQLLITAQALAPIMQSYQVSESVDRLRICHNDISLANLLHSATGGVLIDWEYASLGVIEQELGFCSEINNLTHHEYATLCSIYRHDSGQPLCARGLQLWRRYAQVVNALWFYEQGLNPQESASRRQYFNDMCCERVKKISVESNFTVDLYS